MFGAKIDPAWYLIDTRTAAHLAHVRPSTIRVWHHRGHLQRHGTRTHARWDIREIVARTPGLTDDHPVTQDSLESGGL